MYFSCPALSQSCKRHSFPFTVTILLKKSMPIVGWVMKAVPVLWSRTFHGHIARWCWFFQQYYHPGAQPWTAYVGFCLFGQNLQDGAFKFKESDYSSVKYLQFCFVISGIHYNKKDTNCCYLCYKIVRINNEDEICWIMLSLLNSKLCYSRFTAKEV